MRTALHDPCFIDINLVTKEANKVAQAHLAEISDSVDSYET